MTNPSLPRARRIAGAVLVATTLGLSAATVVPSVSAAASAPAATNVVGLRKGAHGDAVKALQEALVRVGVGVKYGVDGYFGSATQASVKAFQRIKGLSITGVVDAATACGPRPRPGAPAPSAPAAPSTDLLGRGLDRTARRPGAAGADQLRLPDRQRCRRRLRRQHRAGPGAFQKANGLGVSGRTYPSTMRVLGVVAVAAAAAPAVAPHAASAATPSNVLALRLDRPVVVQVQQALTRLGWSPRWRRRRLRRHHRSSPAALPAGQRARRQRPDVPVDDAPPRRHRSSPLPRRPRRLRLPLLAPRQRASPPTTNVARGSSRCNRR